MTTDSKKNDEPSSTFESVLITGANAGLGFTCARKLASEFDGIRRIVLACRNHGKAEEAKAKLEELTGRTDGCFQVLIVDVGNLESVKAAALEKLQEPVEAVMLNAGGGGGDAPMEVGPDGVMNVMQVNTLGHVAFLDALVATKKITKCAIYAGSENAVGIPAMGAAAPTIKSGSVEEMIEICNGTKENKDMSVAYGYAKLLGSYYMDSMSRKHPHLRFVSVSPGASKGTAAFEKLSLLAKLFFKIVFTVLSWTGGAHDVEDGAQRYVDVLQNVDEKYQTGTFWASRKGAAGEMCDQKEVAPHLFYHAEWEDNASTALHSFIK